MADDQTPDGGGEAKAPDPSRLARDPDALKQAHERYGDYLKKVGLPFEAEEFEDDDSAAASPPEHASGEEE